MQRRSEAAGIFGVVVVRVVIEHVRSDGRQNHTDMRNAPVTPKRRILFLLYRFPFPLIGGDRVKAFHLLRHFAEIVDVDLITMDEASEITDEGMKQVSQYANVEIVHFNKLKANLRIVTGLFSSKPIEHSYYYSNEMQQAVNRAISSKEYDLIVSFFLRTAEYVKDLKLAKLLIAEDARVIMQERASEKFSFSPEYFVRRIDAKRLKTFEPSMSANFDHITFVSEEDRARIFAANPRLSTSVVSNGVDLSNFTLNTGERAKSILFSGHLGIYHNKLMAERLISRVFPVIRAQVPGVKLVIVGKDPSDSLRKLIAATDGAELHANVPSVAPYLQREGVFVHPQTVGSGIQNKLLEAMACGIPVVTTSVGAAGIDGLVRGVHAIVRESDEELAQSAVDLLQNATEATRLQMNGRKLIEECYTWEAIFETLDHAIETVVPDFFDSVTAKAASTIAAPVSSSSPTHQKLQAVLLQ